MISDNDIHKLILGFKIKHLRTRGGIPYQELSGKTGLSVSYLNDIEKGKKYPKPDKIRALAEAFEIGYDDLVGTKSDKKLQPVIELLNSGFFKFFPSEEFGFNTEKLIDFFSNSPDRISAFISTILKMARSYQIEKEHFYRIALRSYQDMHDNYFPELEASSGELKKKKLSSIPTIQELKQLLKAYDVKLDEKALGSNKRLRQFRSYYSEEKNVLFLSDQLSSSQKRFLIAKEIGFQFLDLEERPYETNLNKEVSFEKLLNNFKASYFAACLLMSGDDLVADINQMALQTTWNPRLFYDLLKKYQVTSETLLQRFTNVLPKHFGIDDLFFIRLDNAKGLVNYRITKELHLSHLHQPYQNQLSEHLCHRWVSISSIKSLSSQSKQHFVDAQISNYWQSKNSYFCISIAESGRFDNQNGSSITLGLAMNERLKGTFNFLKDPSLKQRTVHTTCETCSIEDCEHRVAPPSHIDQKTEELLLAKELKNL